ISPSAGPDNSLAANQTPPPATARFTALLPVMNALATDATVTGPAATTRLYFCTHTAPPLDTSVEALIGIRMKSTRARNPSIEDRPRVFPIGLPPLAATT